MRFISTTANPCFTQVNNLLRSSQLVRGHVARRQDLTRVPANSSSAWEVGKGRDGREHIRDDTILQCRISPHRTIFGLTPKAGRTGRITCCSPSSAETVQPSNRDCDSSPSSTAHQIGPRRRQPVWRALCKRSNDYETQVFVHTTERNGRSRMEDL